ncbi:hypothetical protein LTR85_003485 [Meristemomyces frigidus]|nr:hypothetical protein LTR85_003485 [Meristemomyces frigidus]
MSDREDHFNVHVAREYGGSRFRFRFRGSSPNAAIFGGDVQFEALAGAIEALKTPGIFYTIGLHDCSHKIALDKLVATQMASLVPNAIPRMAATRLATMQRRRCFHQALSGRSAPSPMRTSTRKQPIPQARCFHRTSNVLDPSGPPKSRDRGPASKEDTQTDFNALNILSNTPAPSTAIDSCMPDGFALNSGLKVTGSGVMLVAGEAFRWRPWAREGRKEGTIGAGGIGDDNRGIGSMAGKVLNAKGQFEVDRQAWGILDLVWPKPDLLVLGTGARIVPVSPETRRQISEMGIRIEVQDTRNAAAQFNLLATERGVQQVVAALVPIGWQEGK